MKIEKILNSVNNSLGISIDTRSLKEGEIFFALKGENFNGNEYVEQALQKGAKMVVASDTKFSQIENVILVEDTLKTLQDIACMHRMNCNIPVIAITGTNGKTTTKELLCTVLSAKYNVLCTKGNFNNHIGVPLTLLGLNKDHEIAVIEMGASHKGEIKTLCDIAKPTHGLITSIGKAHIEGFGSVENIINTKLELFDYLNSNNGLFYYNSTIEELKSKLADKNTVISFRADGFGGNDISIINLEKSYPFLKIVIEDKYGKFNDVNTKLYGLYNFNNLINSIKIADSFNVELDGIIRKLEEYIPQNNRSQILNWSTNKVILDAYNANPTSMVEALKSFISIESDKKKYIILGDMLELGSDSLNEHVNIINFIDENNKFEKVILIGNEFFKAANNFVGNNVTFELYKDSDYAKTSIEKMEIKDSLILAKGSRGIKIEKIF